MVNEPSRQTPARPDPRDIYTPDDFYTPDRVRFWLERWDWLTGEVARWHEGRPARVSRARWARFERLADRKADLERALTALGELREDRFYQRVVWARYVQGMPVHHIATILRTDPDTVDQACDDGIRWMAMFLGWRGVDKDDAA